MKSARGGSAGEGGHGASTHARTTDIFFNFGRASATQDMPPEQRGGESEGNFTLNRTQMQGGD